MTKRYNDTDLREALHRKYADMPELPSDFMAKMEQRMDSVPSDLPTTKHRPLWRWLSIAACVLLIVGVGLMMMPTEQQQKQPILANNTINHVDSIHETESEVTIQKDYPRDTEKNIKSHVQAVKIVDEPQTDAHEEPITINPIIHYAANNLTKDTIPYQDPNRVDDFITELAEYYKVKAVPLVCTSDMGDSTVISTAYLFKDEQELDLFARLLQVACWYNPKTPGYFLNFSQKQFFFKLEDKRKDEKCLWMAERIGKEYVLLFSTHYPKNVVLSSSCFEKYREQLTHIKIQTLNL